MRIGGYGSGFSGFGGGDKGRSDAFKKGRQPGQKVRGRLIKKVSHDTAWVDIEGHKLLAQIRTDAPEGSLLSFVITQLTPNIILRAVFEPSGIGRTTLTLASSFDTARTLMENQLRPHTTQLEQTAPAERKSVFITLLRSNAKLLAAYLDATNCLKDINNSIGDEAGRLHYAPWQIPAARRHISYTRTTSGLIETIAEFDLPNLGMVRSVFLTKDGETGYKLLLQHRRGSAELKQFLSHRNYPLVPGEVKCLDIGQLPQRSHGGIIAELMFKK